MPVSVLLSVKCMLIILMKCIVVHFPTSSLAQNRDMYNDHLDLYYLYRTSQFTNPLKTPIIYFSSFLSQFPHESCTGKFPISLLPTVFPSYVYTVYLLSYLLCTRL